MTFITLITPGGGRPEAFALCEKFMARQTIWNDEIQWIVADDNEKDPVKCTMGQEHIFGSLKWKPGINTLRYNLAAAIPHIKGEQVYIIENDDNIKPHYLEVLSGFLKNCVLVGYCDVTYYNLALRGFKEMNNFQHASLCCTAFHRSYLGHFEKALHSGEQFFDLRLWGNARRGKHKYVLFSGMGDLSVGMKGLPGREGIGFGHTAHPTEFTNDSHFVKLKQLVSEEDAKAYIELTKG